MMSADSENASSGDAGGTDAAAESAPQAATEQDGDAQDSVGGAESRSFTSPELTRDSLQGEAERLQALKEAPESTTGSRALAEAALSACRDGAAWGPGRRVLVTFDGTDAVLVYRPVADGVQQVDLLLCGDDTPTQTLTLPAP